jgi:hypothetical protein
MNIVGQVIDSVTNEPIVDAIVYVSDTAGKPITKPVNADSNGRYALNDVSSNAIIGAQRTGYNAKLTSVKNAIKPPFGFPALLIKLNQSKEATLQEQVIKPQDEKTKISTKGEVKVETTKDEKVKVKEPMKLWVKIALGVGAVTVLGIIIFLATKDKKGKK